MPIALSPQPPDTASGHFLPQHYPLDAIRRAAANRQAIELESEGCGSLLVLGNSETYLDRLSDKPRFFRAPAGQLKIRLLAPNDRKISAQAQTGRDINELLWQAGFYASQGRMLNGCDRNDVVELIHWPNFSRLPHHPSSLRLAALLSRQPTSIFVAMRLLKVSAAELFEFYSAASAAGYVRALNRPAAQPVLPPHRHQSLLLALLKRLTTQ